MKLKIPDAFKAKETDRPFLDIVNGDGYDDLAKERYEAGREKLLARSKTNRRNLGRVATPEGLVHVTDAQKVRTGEHAVIEVQAGDTKN